jgi:hypothetical protein
LIAASGILLLPLPLARPRLARPLAGLPLALPGLTSILTRLRLALARLTSPVALAGL